MQKTSETGNKEQAFIHLNMRAIEAHKANNLKFIIINETHQLAPYRQAGFFDLKATNQQPQKKHKNMCTSTKYFS